MRLSGRRAAVQHAFAPLVGNRASTPHSAKKRATDSSVGVGVSFAHDGVNDGFFLVRGMQKLPQGVPESDQDPALLVDVIRGWCFLLMKNSH